MLQSLTPSMPWNATVVKCKQPLLDALVVSLARVRGCLGERRITPAER